MIKRKTINWILIYLNKLYKTERTNFLDHGDVGHIWYGEDISCRIIQWIAKNVPNTSSNIVDVGCGNGMLSVDLSRNGYTNLTGIDYSEHAIALCKEIASKAGVEITFLVKNILKENLGNGTYDVVIDKGTYDAINLNEDYLERRKAYINSIYNCLKCNGLLILSCCNWTNDELEDHFKDNYKILEVIPTPQFKFGGKVGTIVSSVVFQKNT